MSNSALIMQLRKKALDMLQESTQMFAGAFRLMKSGKLEEAEKLKEQARLNRIDATWLMAQAYQLEQDSDAPDKRG
jgi:hypothetical protein